MSKFLNVSVANINRKRSNQQIFGQLALATMIVLGVAFSSGCSTLPSSLSSNGVFPGSPQNTSVALKSSAQYLVDMQMSYGGSKKFKGNIGQGATVQTAIDASGATKKFRKMDIVVMRNIKGEQTPLKMSCEYNSTKKAVRPETDYALQHGDRVVVTPKSENQLFKMMGTLADGK